MHQIQALLMSAIFAASAPTVLTVNQCNVSDIVVQQDFQLDRYVGKWYEIEWIPAYFENFTDYYTDYFEDYVMTENGMNGTLVGRSGEKCYVADRVYNTTDTPGKLHYKATVWGKTYDMDYWVISTDYEHYSLAYGCTTQTSAGSCEEHHLWIFGRGTTIQAATFETIDNLLEDLCVDKDDLVETSHDKECNEDGSGAGSHELHQLFILMYAFAPLVLQQFL